MNRNIFFDFDGMQFNTLPAHILYINERYKIKTVESDYLKNNHLLEIIKKYRPEISLTKDQVYEDIGYNFLPSIELHQNVKPINGMVKFIPLLAKDFTLWTVTARQNLGLKVIEYLLDKYIPDCMEGIHCVSTRSGNGKISEIPKKNFIQSVSGCNIAFFDDSIYEIMETKNLLPSFLFDPKCLHLNRQNTICRVESWREIAEIFL